MTGWIIAAAIVYAALTVVYALSGCVSVHFKNAGRRRMIRLKTEYPSLYSDCGIPDRASATQQLDAYHRMFWSPLWPLDLVARTTRSYERVKSDARTEAIENGFKAMQETEQRLEQAKRQYAKSSDVIYKYGGQV